MKLTYTKIKFMHGRCSSKNCPVCNGNSISSINLWLCARLTILSTGSPKSPWWLVRESNGDCYRLLKGDLRKPGYYDLNPEIH